jgi:hypothetical protein
MSKPAWAIIEGDAWRVARILVESDLQIQVIDIEPAGTERAAGISNALQELGHQGEEIFLGIESTSCLVSSLDGQEHARLDESTRLYALEEELPVSAEEITAVFLPGSARLLAFSVVTSPWSELLQELELKGIQVGGISPWALLAVQGILKSGSLADADLLLWTVRERTDVFQLENDKLTGWSCCWGDDSLKDFVDWRRMNEPRPVRIVHLWDRPTAGPAPDETPQFLEGAQQGVASLDEWAAKEVLDLSSGRDEPLVQFRQGSLANSRPLRPVRGLLTLAACSILGLLLTMAGLLEWRAATYRTLADLYDQRQQEVYQQVFPDQRPPAGVQSRLRSELARLKGQTEDSLSTEESSSALATLVRTLQALPKNLRFRITRLETSGDEIAIDGEVLKIGDASTIAKSLTDAGFDAGAPSTSQARQGYAMAFVAKFLPEKKDQEQQP